MNKQKIAIISTYAVAAILMASAIWIAFGLAQFLAALSFFTFVAFLAALANHDQDN